MWQWKSVGLHMASFLLGGLMVLLISFFLMRQFMAIERGTSASTQLLKAVDNLLAIRESNSDRALRFLEQDLDEAVIGAELYLKQQPSGSTADFARTALARAKAYRAKYPLASGTHGDAVDAPTQREYK